MIADLITTYGPTVIGAIFAAIAADVARAVAEHTWLRGMLDRLVVESKAAVLEVEQTYVDAIKLAHADGVITSEEAKGARAAAIATLKANLGTKGLARLARILGIDDAQVERLLGTHVEAAVAQLTLAQKAADAGTPPTPAITMSTPPLSSGR